MARRVIQSQSAPAAIGPYSQAVAAGGTVYLSGQVGTRSGNWPARRGRIRSGSAARLREPARGRRSRGLELAAAVRVTVYLTDFNQFTVANPRHAGIFQRAFPGPRDDRRRIAAARRRDRGRLHPGTVTIESRPVGHAEGRRTGARQRGLAKSGIEKCRGPAVPAAEPLRGSHPHPCRSARSAPGERAAVEGAIELAEVVFRGRRSLLVRLSDGTGFLTLRFFHFSGAQQQQLVRGTAAALLWRGPSRQARTRKSCIPNTGAQTRPTPRRCRTH